MHQQINKEGYEQIIEFIEILEKSLKKLEEALKENNHRYHENVRREALKVEIEVENIQKHLTAVIGEWKKLKETDSLNSREGLEETTKLLEYLERLEKLFREHEEKFKEMSECVQIERKLFEDMQKYLDEEMDMFKKDIKLGEEETLSPENKKLIQEKAKEKIDRIIEEIDHKVMADIQKYVKIEETKYAEARNILQEMEQEKIELGRALELFQGLYAKYHNRVNPHEIDLGNLRDKFIEYSQSGFKDIENISLMIIKENKLYENITQELTAEIKELMKRVNATTYSKIKAARKVMMAADMIEKAHKHIKTEINSYFKSTLRNKYSANRERNLYHMADHLRQGIEKLNLAVIMMKGNIDHVKMIVKHFKENA